MRFQKDHRGFSLVELVIVVAIVGVLTGMSLIIINRLRVANVEKVVKSITSAMTKQQMKSMSRENKPYLYLFKVDNDYYLCLSENDTFNAATMKSDGKELGKGITIGYVNGGVETVIDSGMYLRIEFKRDGSFGAGTPEGLKVTGADSTLIKMNQLTGKFVVKHE